MPRTFRIGPHIWFVLHFDSQGKMNDLEEHDWREGGCISKGKGTWEDLFISEARGRAQGEDFQDHVERVARVFLTSTETDYDVMKHLPPKGEK